MCGAVLYALFAVGAIVLSTAMLNIAQDSGCNPGWAIGVAVGTYISALAALLVIVVAMSLQFKSLPLWAGILFGVSTAVLGLCSLGAIILLFGYGLCDIDWPEST